MTMLKNEEEIKKLTVTQFQELWDDQDKCPDFQPVLKIILNRLEEAEKVIDLYSKGFESRGSPDWSQHDVIGSFDVEKLVMPNLKVVTHQGGKSAREYQRKYGVKNET